MPPLGELLHDERDERRLAGQAEGLQVVAQRRVQAQARVVEGRRERAQDARARVLVARRALADVLACKRLQFGVQEVRVRCARGYSSAYKRLELGFRVVRVQEVRVRCIKG